MVARNKERHIKDVRGLIGDPKKLDADLQGFKRQARLFSSHRTRLIEKYPKQWIAVHEGQVKVTGRNLQVVLRELDRKGLPRENTIIRYIDKNLRTLIL